MRPEQDQTSEPAGPPDQDVASTPDLPRKWCRAMSMPFPTPSSVLPEALLLSIPVITRPAYGRRLASTRASGMIRL
ncbi:hypothetical protein FIBSPDRAFT_856103 [Athelia psychrophila]|uniref:Uncharacterized protein n=1 Tax=Athelia psychrophila TaxID=1759441 RepID=A0A166NM11_9AGAM|nr:hypothetical protein FIBSPDRAFT_856103 [Fibularhizoctonia sp. CBS 109695]